jgi:hypothetical protein
VVSPLDVARARMVDAIKILPEFVQPPQPPTVTLTSLVAL